MIGGWLLILGLGWAGQEVKTPEIQVEYRTWSNHAATLPAWLQLPSQYWRDGVWVAIRAVDPAVEAFQITVSYVDAGGRPLSRTQVVQRWHSGDPSWWTNDLFYVGRVRVVAIAVVTLKAHRAQVFKVGEDLPEVEAGP